MSAHVGIEISASACRIIELDRTAGTDGLTIVRSYAQSRSPDTASFAPFRRRQAAVVMWGLHSEHRLAVVTSGTYQHMRREAVAATRRAGLDTRHMLADIALVNADDDEQRRPVVVALARTGDVGAALRTLTSVGVKPRSIVTPALALMSLARMRRRLTTPGMVEAYVAFEETGTAIALIRDGALVAARELDWGYQDASGLRSREDAASRLGDAISAFFGEASVRPSTVLQICVCGGLPELRNMTLLLMERLDIEVEPLDSLFAIDADHLPETADDFRERVVDLRLAWAVAADWNAPIDFLRERRRRATKTALTRAAVVAGVATGIAVAWRLQQSELFQPNRPTRTATAAPAPAVQSAPPRSAPPTAAAPPLHATTVEPSVPGGAASSPIDATPPPIAAPSVVPPAAVVASTPVQTPPSPARVSRLEPPTSLQPAPSTRSLAPEPPRQLPTRAESSLPPVATAASHTPVAPRRTRAEEMPLPFDGALGTILYSADRKLAIVDGRIVQVGDDVRGARVIDITPDAVLFRDVQGRLRKLTLQDSHR